jgi:hypothetical protein
MAPRVPIAEPDMDKLEDRLKRWEKFVQDVEIKGYHDMTLDDWLNDVDLRQLIHLALPLASRAERQAFEQRLTVADVRFRHATVENRKCLWGSKLAKAEKWKPKTHWWWWRAPKLTDAALQAEIEAVK